MDAIPLNPRICIRLTPLGPRTRWRIEAILALAFASLPSVLARGGGLRSRVPEKVGG